METNEQAFHPPTEPVPIQRVAIGSSWPGVVGSIALVFGVLGILQGVMGIVGSVVMGFVASMANAAPSPSGGPNAMAGVAMMEQYRWWMIASALIGAAIAGVLLTGGIGMLRRRAGCAVVLMAWAALKMVWGLVTTGVGVMIQREQMQAMQAQMAQQSQPMPAAMMTGMSEGIMLASLVFGLAWAWALPVFMLVWMNRPKIKAEVRAWRAPLMAG
jgi:hypothetical protein